MLCNSKDEYWFLWLRAVEDVVLLRGGDVVLVLLCSDEDVVLICDSRAAIWPSNAVCLMLPSAEAEVTLLESKGGLKDVSAAGLFVQGSVVETKMVVGDSRIVAVKE